MNANFTSIRDLENIDDKISELESLKLKINEAVRAKVSDDSRSGSIVSTRYEEEKNKRVEEVLEGLNLLLTKPDDEALAQIGELSEQYGNLAVFDNARQLYKRKLELKHGMAFLQKAKLLETEIESLVIEDLSKVLQAKDGLQSLASEHETIPINVKVVEQLSEALDKKIDDFRKNLEDEFKNSLEEIKWLAPKFEKHPIPQAKVASIHTYMSKLFELQAINNTPEYPETWWAVDILLEPIIVRFNYHFNTANKETNKLSKPEWALSFIENFLSENMLYLKLAIGDTIKPFPRIIDYEIINTLLNPVREKMFNMIDSINENIAKLEEQKENREKSGRILSHLIFELSSFDQRLRNVYKFNPYVKDIAIAPSKKWMGLTGDILLHGDNEDLAALNWLNFEFELATGRFNTEIIQSEKAFKIDFDYQASQESKTFHERLLKPTYSAYNLTKLFNNLTSHHKTLNIVKYQLKYVSNIQLKLIDLYHDKLKQLLRSFNDSFNLKLVLNFIPGGLGNDNNTSADSNNTKNGLKGLEILTELYCLTKFISNHLEQWSEELVFIQLWNSYKSISNKTHAFDLTIFDNSMSDFQTLLSKILNNYEQFFRKEIKNSLKSYVNSSQWDISASNNLEASSDLSLLVNNLPIYMSYLEKCLSDLDYYLITNMIVTLLCVVLREFIITNNQFSATGIKQLKIDFEFIISQLKHSLLLLLSLNDYSNINNTEYLKVNESIEFLLKIDSQTAKLYKNHYDKIPELRSKFDGELKHLSNHEINDLVFRIL
ncbi:uncharacterized protein AC631_02282 [Debaryomyces fabryi]|uniref:Uncharacterized protein n=1 Tax=Debaryomyces fabryi TaxID=58627 RepID=A0A0V1Q0G7_9ASCO|nr:uncharacterized protein AC631_02282 [Debaryomyces fabryi]KSA01991.1 hypothetical protein AC631_02282 [Debaryomyces fabryi]